MLKNLRSRNTISNRLIPVFSAIAVLLTVTVADAPVPPGGAEAAEADFWDNLNECTTGLASGTATPDGRPLLWKNRDVGDSDQEFHYVDDGRIPFIAICYSNENTFQYYGGINAAGFAVENSNSYNLPAGPGQNGWGGSDDDGEIQALALATCRTVDDFDTILDSLNEGGRTLNSNYGSFDAFGGAAMFETGGYNYTRVDADEQDDGLIVRANYSYSGNGLGNRPGFWGPNRHDRAFALWKEAVENENLTPKFLIQQVIRNLAAPEMTDYELPYRNFFGDYPYGLIPNDRTICRSTTKAVLVAQGVREGEHPDNSRMWLLGGNQVGSITTPVWVRAGSVPLEYDDVGGSRICDLAQGLYAWVYEHGAYGAAINTWKLHNDLGSGYWDWAFPLEDWVFDKVDRFVNSPEFSFDQLEGFQNTIARQVADSIESWKPSFNSTELAEPVFEDNNIVLYWEPIDEDAFGREDEPRGYNVYRSTGPFLGLDGGDLLAFVHQNHFIDSHPLHGGAYYRVEVVF